MAEKRKKKVNAVPYEEETPTTLPVSFKMIAGIACIGIALVTLYMAFASPREGTAMVSVQNLIRGISGNLPYLFSLMFVWIGVLCFGSYKGKRVNTFHVIVYLIMFLSIFAAVHVFFADTIIQSLNVHSYAQFIATSYAKRIGGGLLGSFMSYFLYEYVGEYAGCAVCALIVLLCLVATGRASRIVDWGKAQNEKNRQRREEQMAHRAQQDGRDFNDHPVRRGSGQRGNRGSAPGNMRNTRLETPEEGARRRQAGRRTEQISNPNRKSIHIPDHGYDRDERRRAATEAFYDPESDDTIGKTKKRVPKTKIDIPKPINELKGKSKNGKISRFADPDSKRRNAGRAAEGSDMFESSVSTEAMSVVAKQNERSKASDRAAQKRVEDDEEITDDVMDEIFTIKEEKPETIHEEDTKFEPTPIVQAPKKTEPDKFAGISRNRPAVKRERTFVETDDSEYNFPPIDLLERGEHGDQLKKFEENDHMKAEILIDTLQSFGIHTRLTGIAHGPAVTRFELQPDAGIKVSRITSLSDDIAMALAAESVRIEAPIPGKPAVGVEIPNDKVETVRLRDVLESSEALHNTSKIAVGLGKDNSGRYVVADIAKMPHVLIAGQTGSGKSVCINSIITSILYRSTPEDVRMILIDPKVVELQVYNDIPHLIAPVVTDPKKASSALQWAVSEMLERYKMFSKKGVRNIKGYNSALKGDEKKMPQIVIVIDELADLMMAAPGEVEDSICRIAQLARAAGMHLVIATQRPSVNVITGIIKANIPTRIAFAVASLTDSRVMIDHGGAEKLLGNGDMLFVPNGGKTLRVQGTWVSDEEVEAVVDHIKSNCDPNYDEDVQEKIENAVKSDAEIEDNNAELDDRLAEAVEIAVQLGQVSVSMLQRKMRVGYARAGRLVDEMQKRGIVSEADGAKPRTVLITREQFREMFGEDI